MKRMLKRDPKERITVDECLKHEFFQMSLKESTLKTRKRNNTQFFENVEDHDDYNINMINNTANKLTKNSM